MIILRDTTVPSEYLDYASNKGIPLTNTELDSNFLTLLDIALNSFPKTGSEVENFVLTAEGSRFSISQNNINLSASNASDISSVRVSADEGIVVNANAFSYNGSPILSQTLADSRYLKINNTSYLPITGGTLTGQLKSTHKNVPISFTDIASDSYRDIETKRDTGKRLGVIRFSTTTTANNVIIGASDAKDNPPSGIAISRALGDGTTDGAVTVTIASSPAKTDSSTKIATTAHVKEVAADYLPLSGGWVTGDIKRSVPNTLVKGMAPTSDYYTYNNYSSINGSTSGSYRLGGWFHYIDTARNSITYMQAYGFNAGSDKVSNIRVRVDVNNVTYTEINSSNITTSSSSIVSNATNIFAIKRNSETYGTELFGGTAYNTSPSLSLYGSSRSSNAGTFTLRSGANSYNLSGTAAGVLTWSGPVVTTSDDSTKIATTAYVKDCVPKSIGSSTKPVFTNSNGVVTASSSTVGSATNPVYLNAGTITATGGTWIKSSAASIAAKGYIQFSNGLILNWGTGKKADNPITFAKAFTSACWSVQLTSKDGGGKDYAHVAKSVTTTGFTCDSYDSDSAVFYFFAIGK